VCSVLIKGRARGGAREGRQLLAQAVVAGKAVARRQRRQRRFDTIAAHDRGEETGRWASPLSIVHSSNCLNIFQTNLKEFDQKVFPCSKNLR
jgi:hypothetical protein